METFGIVGMSFGLTGVTFGVISWSLIAGLRKEFEDLKKNLEYAGFLKERAESEG